MSNKRPILEVDETILSRNLQLEGNNTEAHTLAQLFPDGSTLDLPSKIALPTAGFCVKTFTDGTTKKKVFINVCHTDSIPSPKDISRDNLKDILASDEPDNYRVPMSIGARRDGLDKHQDLCDVYDVAVSTKFFKKVENDPYFRIFLIQVIVEGIANKYQEEISVSNGINILKHRKAMGSIQPHRVQIRNPNAYRNLIEEVSAFGNPHWSKPVDQCQTNISDTSRYALMLVAGEMGRTLVGKFHVPDFVEATVVSEDLKLDLGEDRIRIQALTLNYLVDIFTPFFLHSEHAVAIFDCQTGFLTLTVPVFYSKVEQ